MRVAPSLFHRTPKMKAILEKIHPPVFQRKHLYGSFFTKFNC